MRIEQAIAEKSQAPVRVGDSGVFGFFPFGCGRSHDRASAFQKSAAQSLVRVPAAHHGDRLAHPDAATLRVVAGTGAGNHQRALGMALAEDFQLGADLGVLAAVIARHKALEVARLITTREIESVESRERLVKQGGVVFTLGVLQLRKVRVGQCAMEIAARCTRIGVAVVVEVDGITVLLVYCAAHATAQWDIDHLRAGTLQCRDIDIGVGKWVRVCRRGHHTNQRRLAAIGEARGIDEQGVVGAHMRDTGEDH